MVWDKRRSESKGEFFRGQKNDHQAGVSEEKSYNFNQTGSGFVNSTSYYKIELDKQVCYIVFKNKRDKKNAIMVEPKTDVDNFKDMEGTIRSVLNREYYPDDAEDEVF